MKLKTTIKWMYWNAIINNYFILKKSKLKDYKCILSKF
jgi:hypothetical protein